MPRKSLLLIALVLLASRLAAQDDDYPRPDLTWRTIETPHFLVHFHNGAERSARQIAAIAERVYGPITQMYQHEPDQKVSFVIRDHDDYSNGAAYFYDNKIELWAPALDFELRGTHPWLEDVVSHEFTHIVQIQTAMKLGRRFPAIYFQWLGYEAERRTDVLYGYPNVIVSYPISAFVIPSWFAEGVAQYNHPDFKYDYWDSHRDMILRMYMIDGNPLTWEEMSVFGKSSLGNESSYNAGFSIVQYIADTYGVENLKKISRALGSLPRVTVDGAISDVLGKSGQQLYEEWRKAKTEYYRSVGRSIEPTKVEGTLIEREGFGNFYPTFSPDGKKLAYASNKQEDYFSLSSVYLYDFEKHTSAKLKINARSTLSFSPDGRYLYYSKQTRENGFWAKLFDLYRYDTTKEKEERLTYGLRGWNPRLSRDGSKIVFCHGSDGTANISVSDSVGKNVRQITRFTNGEQVYTPVWSPDGTSIAFGYSDGQEQSVAMIGEDGTDFRIVVSGVDARNPSFAPDGKSLVYAANERGIFNIFELNLEAGSKRQLTNVLGGAFLPTLNAEGALAFASYTSTGYKIAYLEKPQAIAVPTDASADTTTATRLSAGEGTSANVALEDAADRNGRVLSSVGHEQASLSARPYRNTFTSLSIIPLLRVDNYNPRNKGIDVIRPGFYFMSSDMLDRLSLFGGAAVNRQFERDLFVILEYRDAIPLLYQLGLAPTLSIELYNISRKTNVSFSFFANKQNDINTDVTYSLFEFDISLRQKVLQEGTQLKFGYTLSRYSADIGTFSYDDGMRISQGSRDLYLIGNTLSAHTTHSGIHPSVDRDINPIGRTVSLRLSYDFSRLVSRDSLGYSIYEETSLGPRPKYASHRFPRLELRWHEHIPIFFRHNTFTASLQLGATFGPPVDHIFDFYAGGFVGMRGYPFYSLGGNDFAAASATYRFPLSTKLNFRFLQFYFTKLYGSVFGDLGDAWSGAPPSIGKWKKDVGFEFRLEAFSFYQYPTRISFAGAYGFDRFTRTFNNVDVTYGREWRFYVGVLFGFELNPFERTPRHTSPALGGD